MPLPMNLSLPGVPEEFTFEAGQTTIVVGANGSGKTKMAVAFEKSLGESGHRISAQRKLSIDPSIDKVSESVARSSLRFGLTDPSYLGGGDTLRPSYRWGAEKPRFILDDAGALLQVLFAEQANTAVAAYNAAADGAPQITGTTLMRQLREIFTRVLPARDLQITADDIQVIARTADGDSEPYSAAGMSDGEKAVLYYIGQVLVAEPESVFILDEPEIHVHRSILSRLWDELEAARSDCAFLLITHDLDFAASRTGEKYVVREYSPESGWTVERVPEAAGFSEDLVTLILGSRKPILFVEGEIGSLDLAFYRACYPDWTILPRGSCENVIHAVVTLRRNSEFTRVTCAGLVDADAHDQADRSSLASNGISVLPVSEIENLLLRPEVSRVVLEMNFVHGQEADDKLQRLADAIFADASTEANVDDVVLRFCRRRIDRALKQVDLSDSRTTAALAQSYAQKTAELDIPSLAQGMREKIARAVEERDLASLLAIYDRKKPLLNLAGSHLSNLSLRAFEAWVTRAILGPSDDRLRLAVSSVLPDISTT